MTAIKLDTGTAPPPAASKSGEGYDRCPTDGCIEVDRSFKNGGRNSKGELYSNWDMFHADPRKGGCGTSWTRTTKQGLEHDQARGINPKWLTKSAQADRFTLTPSEQYRENYERIFGHD